MNSFTFYTLYGIIDGDMFPLVFAISEGKSEDINKTFSALSKSDSPVPNNFLY